MPSTIKPIAANSCSRSLNARRTSPELPPERLEFVASDCSCDRLFELRPLDDRDGVLRDFDDRPLEVRADDDRFDVEDPRERDCEVAIA
jgi:hypothetical protein